jgi:hypothetical protein
VHASARSFRGPMACPSSRFRAAKGVVALRVVAELIGGRQMAEIVGWGITVRPRVLLPRLAFDAIQGDSGT